MAAGSAYAQQSQPAPQDQAANPPAATAQKPAPSLADAARKAREQKKDESKQPKVFTNDNLPTGGVNVVGDASLASRSSQPDDASSTSGNSEKDWRNRFSKARAKLSRDQADLDVLQRELGKLSVQYYPDPNKQLMQSITNEDLIKQRAKIDAKKADVAADQQALSDLEDSLRKAGGDPGWAR